MEPSQDPTKQSWKARRMEDRAASVHVPSSMKSVPKSEARSDHSGQQLLCEIENDTRKLRSRRYMLDWCMFEFQAFIETYNDVADACRP